MTATMYRTFATAPSIRALIERIGAGVEVDADEVDAVFDDAPIDPGAARAMSAVANEIAEGSLLAVRSSATVEDLDRSSFAGQYRSVLGVNPADPAQLESAVKQVFASLWHPAPCAYRRAFGIADDDIAMAVVLMRMVPAELSGVVFTLDPGGDPKLSRIEQVAGFGESLVSGQETPEAFLLSRWAQGARTDRADRRARPRAAHRAPGGATSGRGVGVRRSLGVDRSGSSDHGYEG